MEPIFRLTRPGDEEQLKQVWADAYDGDTVCAERYFASCYHPGDGIAAEVDGTLCSAIYLMEHFVLHVPEKKDYDCCYLYALGTPDRYRGQGLGGRTIWRSGAEGYMRGCDYVCFLPASDSLSLWYQDILGAKVVFFHRRGNVTRTAEAPVGTLTGLSAEEYAAVRAQLLGAHTYAQPSEDGMRLQRDYCALYGGGFYRIDLNGASGICACDVDGESLTLRELLMPDGDVNACAQLAMKHFACSEAEVRTPAFWHDGFGTIRGDCVHVPGGTRFPSREAYPYWGLAMD